MRIEMFNTKRLRKIGLSVLFLGLVLVLTSCTMTMREQPRLNPLSETAFYANQAAARPPVADTIARGYSQSETDAENMLQNFDEAFPFAVTVENLKRGQQRYDIYCSPCHDRVGTGNGMIVQRGFKKPSSFHDERLRTSPPSYFYGAMTNGFGTMPSYANRIAPKDRWLIAAYIQALQLSQNAELNDVPDAERSQLEGSK
jgi:mono/diheme cytochrome c family protein